MTVTEPDQRTASLTTGTERRSARPELDPSPAPDTGADPDQSAGPDQSSGAEVVVDDARRRTWILVTMCTALVAVVTAGFNVAQQALALDLGASQDELLWVINGYTIALAALLLPIGAIGDRWGRKRVLMTGLVVFAAAYVASSQARSVEALIAFRVLAGVGAAMIMPVTLSVITSTFPAEDRDRAVGVWAGFAGAGVVLGMIVSSLIIDHLTWRWIVALPVGLAVVALPMTARLVPAMRGRRHGRFDLVGSVLSVLAVGALVLAIHEGPGAGWTAPSTLGGLLIGSLAAVGFVVWELGREHPLLPVRVFRHRTVTAGSVNLLVVFGIMGGLFLVLVQFMQAVLGFTALGASIGLLPMAVIIVPLSTIAPRLAGRLGLRRLLTGGTLVIAAGLALMATLTDVDRGYMSILPGLLVVSVGIGAVMTPGTAAITAALPVEEQGVASALNDTTREIGTTVGVALIGSILSAGYSSAIAPTAARLPEPAAQLVGEGIGGAVVVSEHLGPVADPLLHAARVAFVDGWSGSMWVSIGVAIAAAAFNHLVLSRHHSPHSPPSPHSRSVRSITPSEL